MSELLEKYHNWKFKNTTFLILSLVLLFFIADYPIVKNTVLALGEIGYVGIFLTGMFFVSTFTVAPASVVLYFLAQKFNPATVALVGGLGAAFGDFIILKFLKDRVFDELYPLFKKYADKRIKRIFKTPYFAWLSPLIGIIIIASPFPDEIGIALLGVSKLKSWQFFLISYIVNALGIFIIVSIARAV